MLLTFLPGRQVHRPEFSGQAGLHVHVAGRTQRATLWAATPDVRKGRDVVALVHTQRQAIPQLGVAIHGLAEGGRKSTRDKGHVTQAPKAGQVSPPPLPRPPFQPTAQQRPAACGRPRAAAPTSPPGAKGLWGSDNVAEDAKPLAR